MLELMTVPVQPDPILEVNDLVVSYPVAGHGEFRAVAGTSFSINRGETLGLVGESGCGKSSIARAVMQLSRYSGSVRLEGRELHETTGTELRGLRRRFQMIFQDPISSLNPRRRINDILLAPLKINGLHTDKANSDKLVSDALETVGLDPRATLNRYPHEFSGGQCQRISIARAIILNPVLLVCDEAVSALDVSVRAQVLNVLNDLQRKSSLSILFISHDFAVIRNVSDVVAVMYLGKICEIGPADRVLSNPSHPYTQALLASIPQPDPSGEIQKPLARGEMPSPLNPPTGCRFRTRCRFAQSKCEQQEPPVKAIEERHDVWCHFPLGRPTA